MVLSEMKCKYFPTHYKRKGSFFLLLCCDGSNIIFCSPTSSQTTPIHRWWFYIIKINDLSGGYVNHFSRLYICGVGAVVILYQNFAATFSLDEYLSKPAVADERINDVPSVYFTKFKYTHVLGCSLPFRDCHVFLFNYILLL